MSQAHAHTQTHKEGEGEREKTKFSLTQATWSQYSGEEHSSYNYIK